MTPDCYRTARTACAATLLASLSFAQCELSWHSGAGSFGPGGYVSAIVERPNGDLVVAGSFDVADSVRADGVARWDGTSWQPMGDGLGGSAYHLVTMPNGDLIAAGGFAFSGGNYIGRVARWDGTAWQGIGADIPGTVFDLIVAPNGDLIIVGTFNSVGNVPVADVARWDGTAWYAMGDPQLVSAEAVTILPNGQVCVGGTGMTFQHELLSWNGTAWQPLAGVGVSDLWGVKDLTVLGNGDLIIQTTLAPRLHRWDGASLAALNEPLSDVHEIETAANGDLLVGGALAAGPDDLFRFDGTSWSTFGDSAYQSVLSIAQTANGDLVVGSRVQLGTAPTESPVRRFSNGQWQRLGNPSLPAPGDITRFARLPNGDLIAAGEFDQILGTAANNIARWDGSSWHAMGLGVDGAVNALKVTPDGSLLVGGAFQTAGGAPAPYVARWSQGNWSTVGGNPGGPVFAIEEDVNGVIAAWISGAPAIRRFENGTWTAVPGALYGGPRDIAALPGGGFALLGVFLTPSLVEAGGIRFDTTIQSYLPGGQGRPVSDVVRDGDDVIMLTTSQGQREVSVLAGDTITPVTTIGAARFLSVLPDGDFVVALSNGDLQRFDGTSWTSVLPPAFGGYVDAIGVDGRGDVMIAGRFLGVDDLASIGLARASTNCRPAVSSFGAGCTGSNGTVTLSSLEGPWLSGAFAATATGMTSNSLALSVLGTGTNASSLPLGLPGCSLFGTPVFFDFAAPNGSEVEVSFAIPATPALATQTVTSQVLGLELDAGLNLTGVTASNALLLTIGAL